jgi:hypothetical protein
MNSLINTKDPLTVRREAEQAYLAWYPGGDPEFVPQAFDRVIDCFLGKYRDYQPIDALYHDLEHTLQGTLCLVRLLCGRTAAGVEPRLTQRMFELGLLSILLHDTGYLKRNNDVGGTGAKYTYVHVGRSAEFAKGLLTEMGFSPAEISSVQNMIHCTGVKLKIGSIPFQSRLEREIGQCVGTADLLGQMAAEDYPSKLSILFLEFAEAARRDPGNAGAHVAFANAEELIRNTPAFWENFVKPKLDNELGGAHRHLIGPDRRNQYFDRIERNIDRIRRQIAVMPERRLQAA